MCDERSLRVERLRKAQCVSHVSSCVLLLTLPISLPPPRSDLVIQLQGGDQIAADRVELRFAARLAPPEGLRKR